MSRPAPALLLALLAITAPACRDGRLGRSGSPDGTNRAFAAAARTGDAARVWSLLSERSRAALEARATALAGRGLAARGEALVLGDLSATSPRLAKVEVVRESAEAAVVGVTVEGDDRAREVELVREGGGWRVVLPGS